MCLWNYEVAGEYVDRDMMAKILTATLLQGAPKPV
jgi:hypothetical protein